MSSAQLESHQLKHHESISSPLLHLGVAPKGTAPFSLPIPELRAQQVSHIVCTSDYIVSIFRSDGVHHLRALDIGGS